MCKHWDKYGLIASLSAADTLYCRALLLLRLTKMPAKYHVITPYWQRLPHFFLFPLQLPALLISLSYALLSLFLKQPSLLFSLLHLVLALVLLKYAYAALRTTAQGQLLAPPLSRNVMITGYELPLKQGLVFLLVMQFAAALALHVSQGFATLVLLVFWFILPANVVILASTRSLISSLNGVILFNLITRLGWHYFALYGLLLGFYIGWEIILGWFFQQTPTPAIGFLTGWINAYCLLLMFHVMGYIIYQYHEAIGVDISATETDPNGPKSSKQDDDPRFALFEKLMGQENYAAAADELIYHIQKQPEDSALHFQLHRVLQLSQDQQRLCQHGRQFISLLLTQHKKQQALTIYEHCKAANSDFTLHEFDYESLAEMLRIAGRGEDAVKLLDNFHAHYPGSTELPQIVLLAAKILLQDLHQKTAASKRLDFLQRNFPDHTIQSEVQIYQTLLAKL